VNGKAVGRYGFLDAPEGRALRGERIVAALADFGGIDAATSRILDVGCSAGLITDAIAGHAREVVGVDVDVEGVSLAAARRRGPRFVAASGDALPFADASFDAAVCNHVYEHVRDAHVLVRELYRVLRPGGACYFAAGHTLQLLEPHHRLPLLSCLPRTVANAWLRARGSASGYEERFVAPWALAGLLAPFDSVRFVSPQMLADPARYRFPQLTRHAVARVTVRMGARIVARLAPTWIYVMRKRVQGAA
jgi:SAM-dependent methyltransferase